MPFKNSVLSCFALRATSGSANFDFVKYLGDNFAQALCSRPAVQQALPKARAGDVCSITAGGKGRHDNPLPFRGPPIVYPTADMRILRVAASSNNPAQSDRLQRCALPAAAGRER